MNIWNIKNDLLNIYNELEENGGELTEELEEALLVTQENFKEKVESYVNVIKSINSDIEAIKLEQKRLKDLSERKQKSIDKLKDIVVEAIEQFGDIKKSGTKYFNYGTGEVSIRKTKVVDINTDCVDKVADKIATCMRYAREYNQLDESRVLETETLISMVGNTTINEDELKPGYIINRDDLEHMDVKLSIKVPVNGLFDADAYPIIREMARFSSDFNVEPAISKSELKKSLEENGVCAPHIAKLKINKNIIMK